jgi:hypothetical protein
MFRDADSVVFLRPFKMLIFFQKELNSRFDRLVAKFENLVLEEQPGFATSASDTQTSNGRTSAQLNPSIIANNRETYAVEEEALESALALEHMRPLLEFFDNYISPRQTYLASALCQKITFHDMWLLFKPGEVVIESDGNQAYRIFQIDTPSHRAIPPWENFERKERVMPSRGMRTVEPHLPQPQPSPPPPQPSQLRGDDKPFIIWCVYINSDGFNLGPVNKAVHIDWFEGDKLVTDLPVYPLRFRKTSISEFVEPIDADPHPLQLQLIERGKRFLEMNSIHHAYYTGPTYKTRDLLEGQVVIDNSQVFKDRTRSAPTLSRWRSPSGAPTPWDHQSASCNATCCDRDMVWEDGSFDERRNFEYQDGLWPLHRGETPSLAVVERPLADAVKDHTSARITDDEYLIMSDMVYGFVLRTRKWAQLNLAHISNVSYNSDVLASTADQSNKKAPKTAFDDLVLPPGHKEVILSLVAQHFRDEEHHEVDIFQGKGKGLILLLHGAPGVGKTSTAEGVAQAFKKPLLQITCGKN